MTAEQTLALHELVGAAAESRRVLARLTAFVVPDVRPYQVPIIERLGRALERIETSFPDPDDPWAADRTSPAAIGPPTPPGAGGGSQPPAAGPRAERKAS